jgi:PAS domain S-box-containing protein
VALQSAEEKYRQLIETTDTGYVILDDQGHVLDANSEYVSLTGRSLHEEVIGHSVLEWTAPHDHARNAAEVAQCVDRGYVRNLEIDYIDPLGNLKPIEINATLFRIEGSMCILSLCRDITERKQAEAKLQKSEQFVRNILDTVDEGFIVLDRDYRILTANKAFCRNVGCGEEKIIGRYCYEVSHRVGRPCFEEGEECAVKQVFETGNPHTTIHRRKSADGNILIAETKAYPIKDASGAVNSVIETIINITEKNLLEEERLKTQKMESIGTLAGGIAHDFNNLLQGLFGYIAMAKMTIDQKEKALSMLDQAEEALHLTVNLTTQLLTFSKGGKPVKNLIKIRPVVENAVKFALSGSHTNYEMDIPADSWSVEADEGQLAQVIQNIVLNANEAMAGSGTVRISLANMLVAKDSIVSLHYGGLFVRVSIQDSGIGIPEQNLARIFDPYFTTKQKGSGLGLATSYSIIKNHGGVIDVKSEINCGTTFTIYLPAIKDAEIGTMTTTSNAVKTKKGKILLMDDEEMVRNVGQEMFALLGHDLVSAEDGRKAIELFQQAREAGTPFDLVILDLTVKGGMGGNEAIAALLKIDPQVKAVVSSGYSTDSEMADYRKYGYIAVLSKPYKLQEIGELLQELL